MNVNAGKYYYDDVQTRGVPLPDEKNLPGVLPTALSGNTTALKAGSISKKSSNCTAAGGMKVSAQAASC